MDDLLKKGKIKGLLLDIDGVLYVSGEGDGEAINGSIAAVKKLQSANFPVRFVSNGSTSARRGLVKKLNRLGFELCADQVFTPAPAAVKYLLENQLRPHLLIHSALMPEFTDIDQNDPNCVVLGDAQNELNWESMNAAFQVLMSLKTPILIALGGAGKYYYETDGYKLDVGAIAKAYEYACDIKSVVIGKPSESFFMAAVNDLGLSSDQVAMVGDDIISDVGGSQKSGLWGVQVRTGNWRNEWQNHTVKPDCIVNNLAEIVEKVLVL